jgi:hypothetical protein
MVEDVTTALTQLKRRRKRHHNSRTESSFPLGSIAVGTPGMGVILSGESLVYETGSLKEISVPNDRSD